MTHVRFAVSTAVLLVSALVIPAAAFAQGDPAPRGGAGTNLPGAVGSGAAAEARAANATVSTSAVTMTPAGAPTASESRAMRELPREGSLSPSEAHRRLEAIREGRAGGADAGDRAAIWYSQPGGPAAAVEVMRGAPGAGDSQTRGPEQLALWTSDPGGCMAAAMVVWDAQSVYERGRAIPDACRDGGWVGAYNAWANYRRPYFEPMDAYDPRVYWGNPAGSGMGYSQRSGGYSRTYANAGLKLNVTPSDASVYVDGFYAGQVRDFDGVIRRLPLNPGPHRVEFNAKGLAPLVVEVEVGEGQTVTYSGQLKR